MMVNAQEMRCRRIVSWMVIAGLVVTGFILGWALQQSAESQRQSRAAADMWYEIVHETDQAIVVLDHDGLIVFFNPAAEELFGRPRREVLGTLPQWMIPGAQWRSHRQALDKAFNTSDTKTVMIRTCIANVAGGKTAEVQVRVQTVRNSHVFAVAQITPTSEIKVTSEGVLHESEP